MSRQPDRRESSAGERLLERAYGVLLRRYPVEFRHRCGAEMAQAFRDGCADQVGWRKPLGSVIFLGRELVGGLRNSAKERRRGATRLSLSARRDDGGGGPPRRCGMARLLDDLRTDLRLALRSLRRDPAFAAAAIGTLALGIGATVAVFGLYNTLLARSLAGLTPDEQLVRVLFHGDRPYNFHRVSAPNYRDLITTTDQFETTTAYRSYPANITVGETEPFSATLEMVLDNYFATLRMPLQHGRAFTALEGTDPAASRLAVLSAHMWHTRFASDPDILNRSVHINRRPYRIVGVAAERFRGLERFEQADLWVPAAAYGDLAHFVEVAPDFMMQRDVRLFGVVVGRLKPEATARRAEEQMRAGFAALITRYPELNRLAANYAPRVHADIDRSVSYTTDGLVSVFAQLGGAVALVLLIATANVANLLFSRGLQRRGEVAVRQALGASRGRLYRQFLTESMLLGLVAGCLGAPLSAFITQQVRISDLGFRLPEIDVVAFDLRVVLFTILVALGSGLLAGATSISGGGDTRLAERLRSVLTLPSGKPRRLRDALTVAQVAASMAVLIAALLLVRSLHNLRTENQGFEPRRITGISYDLYGNQYSEGELESFYREISAGLDAMGPTVEYAFASPSPYTGTFQYTRVLDRADPAKPSAEDPLYSVVVATRGYFETLGLQILRGTTFSSMRPADSAALRDEVVVSASLARALFGDQNPISRNIQVQMSRQYSTFRVVGVVADARQDPRRDEEAAQVYVPIEHERLRGTATLLVRPLTGQPIAAVRQLLRDFDPTLPLEVTTLAERFEVRIAVTRALTGMVSLLSAVALGLAAIGLHAAIMFSVLERTREIGIRTALGAPTATVIRMVLRRAARVATSGLVIGTGIAWALSRTLTSNLYGVAETDAFTYLVGASALLTLGLIACVLPARHAARIDPLLAIRSE